MTSLVRLQLAPPTAPARLTLAHESGSSALRLERGNHRAWLHVPSSARDQDTAEPLPLLVVLHGAGKNRFWDLKESVDSWAARAEAHGMAVLFPEALQHTWDFIHSKRTQRRDFDFLEECLSELRRRFSIDERRIALLGISDGGSVALTLATHNPKLFQAALSVSAGFCSSPPSATKSGPKLFMLHGSHDSMFQLSRIGLPLRDKMKQLGYDVEHRVGEGHGHVPPGWQEEFLPAWLAMPVGG